MDTNNGEAQDVHEQERYRALESVPVDGDGSLEFKSHDGDYDRHHAVAEGFQSTGVQGDATRCAVAR